MVPKHRGSTTSSLPFLIFPSAQTNCTYAQLTQEKLVPTTVTDTPKSKKTCPTLHHFCSLCKHCLEGPREVRTLTGISSEQLWEPSVLNHKDHTVKNQDQRKSMKLSADVWIHYFFFFTDTDEITDTTVSVQNNTRQGSGYKSE